MTIRQEIDKHDFNTNYNKNNGHPQKRRTLTSRLQLLIYDIHQQTHVQTEFNDRKDGSFQNFILVMIIFAVFGTLCFILILPEKFQEAKKLQQLVLQLLLFTMLIINTMLQTPLLISMMEQLVCDTSTFTIDCYQEQARIANVVTSLGAGAIMIIITFFIENLYNYQFINIMSPKPSSSSSRAVHGDFTTNLNTLILMPLLCKIFNIAINELALGDLMTKITFIISIILQTTIVYFKWKNLHFMNYRMQLIKFTGHVVLLYLYTIGCIFAVVHVQIGNGEEILLGFGLLGLFPMSYVLLNKYRDNILNMDPFQIKNKQLIEKYFYTLLGCIMSNQPRDRIFLQGLFKQHKRHCQDKISCMCNQIRFREKSEDCKILMDSHMKFNDQSKTNQVTQDPHSVPISNGNSSSANSKTKYKRRAVLAKRIATQGFENHDEMSLDQLIQLHIVNSWLEQIIDKTSNHRLQLILSYVLAVLLQHDLKSLFQLSHLQKNRNKLSRSEQIAVYCYQKHIFSQFNRKQLVNSVSVLQPIQIEKLLEVEHNKILFINYINDTMQLAQVFWQSLQSKNNDLKSQYLSKITSNISMRAEDTEKVYKEIRKSYPDYLQAVFLYEGFVRNVMNYEEEAEKELQTLNMIFQKVKIRDFKMNHFEEEIIDMNKNTGVMLVSCNKNSLGTIHMINKELCEFLLCDKNRFIRQNISTILPDCIDTQTHNKMIENYFLNNSESSFIYKRKKIVWVKNIFGFLKLIEFYVQPYFDQQRGLYMIGLAKPLKVMQLGQQKVSAKDLAVVLVNQNGHIIECSQNFANLMSFTQADELKSSNIEINQFNESLFNPSFMPQLEQGTKVTFALPKYDSTNIRSIQEAFFDDQALSNKMAGKNENQTNQWGISMFTDQETNKLMTQNEPLDDEDFSFNSKNQLGQSQLRGQSQYMRYYQVQTQVQADFTYLNDHQFLSFAVYYISLNQQNQMSSIQNSSTLQIEESVDEETAYNPSSQSVNSESRESHFIKELKNENQINKKPQIISFFQKIFVIYFLLFLGISSGIMIISYSSNETFISNIYEYHHSKDLVQQTIQIGNSVRRLINLRIGFEKDSVDFLKNREKFYHAYLDNSISEYQGEFNDLLKIVLDEADEMMNFDSGFIDTIVVQIKNLQPNGLVTITNTSFTIALQQLLSSAISFNGQIDDIKKCNCLFRPNDLTGKQSYTNFERDVFFILENIQSSILPVVTNYGTMQIDLSVNKSVSMQWYILYFSIGCTILTLIGSIAFFPVQIRTLRNLQKTIQIILKIKLSTIKSALEQIDQYQRLVKIDQTKEDKSKSNDLNDQQTLKDSSFQLNNQFNETPNYKRESLDSSIENESKPETKKHLQHQPSYPDLIRAKTQLAKTDRQQKTKDNAINKDGKNNINGNQHSESVNQEESKVQEVNGFKNQIKIKVSNYDDQNKHIDEQSRSKTMRINEFFGESNNINKNTLQNNQNVEDTLKNLNYSKNQSSALGFEVYKVNPQSPEEKIKVSDIRLQKKQRDYLNGKRKNNDDEDEESHSDDENAGNIKGKKGKQKEIQRTDLLKLRKEFRMHNLKSTLKITILSLFFCSFFIVMYFLNTESFDIADDSLYMLNTFYGHTHCIGLLILYTQETIIRNQTLRVNFINGNLDALFDHCLRVEYDYQNLRKNIFSFEKEVKDYMDRSETYQMCDLVAQIVEETMDFDGQFHSIDTHLVMNDIMHHGLSSVYHFMIQELRKLLIFYQSGNKTASSLKNLIYDSRWSEVVTFGEMYVISLLKFIDDNASEKVLEYYEHLLQRSIIFYTSFVVLLIASVIFIVGYVMKAIQRGIYYNKKTLKFIPRRELRRKSMAKIMTQIKY